jgi:hypothetical protein
MSTNKKVEPTAKKSGIMSDKSGQTPPKKTRKRLYHHVRAIIPDIKGYLQKVK